MIDFTHEDIERLWDSVVHYVPERQRLDMAIDFIKVSRTLALNTMK